eukprot:gene14848-biopygen12669
MARTGLSGGGAGGKWRKCGAACAAPGKQWRTHGEMRGNGALQTPQRRGKGGGVDGKNPRRRRRQREKESHMYTIVYIHAIPFQAQGRGNRTAGVTGHWRGRGAGMAQACGLQFPLWGRIVSPVCVSHIAPAGDNRVGKGHTPRACSNSSVADDVATAAAAVTAPLCCSARAARSTDCEQKLLRGAVRRKCLDPGGRSRGSLTPLGCSLQWQGREEESEDEGWSGMGWEWSSPFQTRGIFPRWNSPSLLLSPAV